MPALLTRCPFRKKAQIAADDQVGLFSIMLALAFQSAYFYGAQANTAGSMMMIRSVAFCLFVILPVLQHSAARAQKIVV